MSCHKHGYPWPSLATSPYRSSPPAGLQGYIPYPHIAAVCMFKLVVLLLLGHMWGSIGVHNCSICWSHIISGIFHGCQPCTRMHRQIIVFIKHESLVQYQWTCLLSSCSYSLISALILIKMATTDQLYANNMCICWEVDIDVILVIPYKKRKENSLVLEKGFKELQQTDNH